MPNETIEKIRIITEPITTADIKTIAAERFGDMVKAVADVSAGTLALGGEMHADEEAILLERGSKQADLWGFNIYPDLPREQWLEFDSMINIRPSVGNRSRNVGDREIREKIIAIVNKLIIS